MTLPESKPRNKARIPDWMLYTWLGLFAVFIIVISFTAFNITRNIVADLPVDIQSDNPGINSGQADNPAAEDEAEVYNPADPISITNRFTVLVLGIDERESESGPWRTDTMIVLTIDPVSQTAGMLSIPRDVWVELPGYENYFTRINQAYFKGDADNYPGGGGPALALKTVRERFGIPVDYYLTINFQAFTDVMSYMDCVPITVYETIDDPDYPAMDGVGFDPLYLEAGEHCMDGELLLKYARTRATYGGDFDRAARQQQVLRAIRSHILSTDQLPGLLAQAPEIYNDVQHDIGTNLSLNQLIDLARLASKIPDDAICSAVVNNEYVELSTLPNGDQVLIPNIEEVRELRWDMFTGTGRCAPDYEELAGLAAAEAATVSLYNGTTQEGLATQTRDFLAGQGINIVHIDNAATFDYVNTIIFVYTGKNHSARYLARILDIPETAIVNQEDPAATEDIKVILGADYLK